ncbi:pyruvate/2-oxoglutarate dehydrogenase complex dihydrolipoamide acyltransferase (E2) component [Pseudarthrobacter siccitolerans]|uniref:Pyruvate/2-oxoglutarate dehydrogenase complex dihydrolipoamide acyltransferase (E2) component n=1 Tax=Pseudarthrobacter siccitolerans TaxID=861266 RepID=A0ABU0PL72_9MICC|nr:2-oxo acid dehydrogenase subunit E2 [Pseudarthrobacter siccitolerans]MDQ0674713.1 pyruvate/2-oxoglutarate dehydrogenase complex dihydrolipoamide acyltransferase (E2) component [Pseudarthrobacter siccitolerans]
MLKKSRAPRRGVDPKQPEAGVTDTLCRQPQESSLMQDTDHTCTELIKVRGARKITAQRMRASLQETAQVTLTRYADATNMVSLRASLKKQSTENPDDVCPTVNDIIMYCASRVLETHTEINALFTSEGIERHSSVNLGFAVDTGKSLLVPVIHGANGLSLKELAQRSKQLIELAKTGKITMDAMTGGTFTVSNLGGLGIHWFTPVLNAPEVGILGIGAMHTAVPGSAPQIPLSLTFDHQALDGAAAATVLAAFATAIEDAGLTATF